MNSVTVRLPNGQTRTATYRSECCGMAGYVRVNHNGQRVTVSGEIVYIPSITRSYLGASTEGHYRFKPTGTNAGLVEG